MNEDIRTVAMLVRNQISFLKREKAHYQNKLAPQQEQNLNQATPQTSQVPCNNPVTYQYQNSSNTQQSETSKGQELYQQQLYKMQQMQMQHNLNQQISAVSQQPQYGSQYGYESADYQVHQLHYQDAPSMTQQQILPQQVQVQNQQHSLPTPQAAPQLLNQQMINTSHPSPTTMCSQYQTPNQSYSQYQQVTPQNIANSRLPSTNIQPVPTPDSPSNISPDNLMGQVSQSLNELPLKIVSSSACNPSPSIISQQNFQGMQNLSEQNQIQLQSPQRVLSSQPSQTLLSNVNSAHIVSNNQVLLNQSPQKTLSPHHPTNLPLAYLQNPCDSNQVNNANPPPNYSLPTQPQMQISQSTPAVNFKTQESNYPYQEIHLNTNESYAVQESQPLVQQMSGSNVPSKPLNTTATEMCVDPTQVPSSSFNQVNFQDILPRQTSLESENFIGTPDENILPPSMTTSITSEYRGASGSIFSS